MHRPVTNPDFERLSKWINRYDGFFTSKHAQWSGYSLQNQVYYVKSGQWERYGSGIFRYKLFPHSAAERPDLIVATLWSCNRAGVPQGVISHDTALAYHKLSTWSGNGVHMIVPKNFRRRALCKFKVRLHFDSLHEEDFEDIGPYRVTSPLRTLIDVVKSRHIERTHVVDAVADALRKKQVTFSEIKSASLDADTKRLFAEILEHIGHTRADEI